MGPRRKNFGDKDGMKISSVELSTLDVATPPPRNTYTNCR